MKSKKAASKKYLIRKAFIILRNLIGIAAILFGAFLCIGSFEIGSPFVVLGVLLLVWANFSKRKLKKLELKVSSTDATVLKPNVEHISADANSQQIPEKRSEIEKNYDLFEEYDADDETYLAYQYELDLAFADTATLTGNGGKVLSFRQEPDNPYDSKAVAAYLEDVKVGYLHRGRIQDMVNDWIVRDEPYWGYVNKIDVTNNKATVKIGFYKKLATLNVKKFRLTHITKKASEYGNSRCENVSWCSNGELVDWTDSYETENYIITNESGEELGEVGAKAVEFINEFESSIKFMRINSIEETDTGSYKAFIEIFYK